ncbi:hypothetical protein JNB88_14355 [Rhizobium cauense]|uniref:hypothetical protein n=1 Tax=Rhizobium cauense TaxID=1166683 RepID=UPI001C6F0996|nr:hypothetical protein [Rhizobium cauense]MBW9114822.1 hypothetical protein [Rhizobium cauense]
MFRTAIAIAVVCTVTASEAAAERYRANEIKEEVVGRRIFLAAPLGGEFPLNYRTTGSVDGDGEALGLGRFVKPKDTGTWWIQSDRLCQRFRTWYDGRSMCFELYRVDQKRLKWIRDDGKTGIARIGPEL